MLAYWDAQNDYADMTKSKSGQAVYAQRIVSSPGKKDGLYWPTSGNEKPSPLGDAVAAATQRGYRVGAGEPFNGYRFKRSDAARARPRLAVPSIMSSTAT